MNSYHDESEVEAQSVLLVDDNRINQMVATQLLKRAGVVTDTVDSAEEALRRLRSRDYRLVLMDVQMPGMTGIEATQIIRDPDSNVRNHDVPIIAMTAFSSEQDRSACLSAGVNEFLTKPLQIDRFVALVRRLLAGEAENPGSDPHPLSGSPADQCSGSTKTPPGVAPLTLPVIDHNDLFLRIGSNETAAPCSLR